jgi:hypothetical protein
MSKRTASTEPHIEALRASPKFLKWAPEPLSLEELLKTQAMDEKHYAPDELATLWGVSAETIRNIFRDEQGVLKIGKTGAGTSAGM